MILVDEVFEEFKNQLDKPYENFSLCNEEVTDIVKPQNGEAWIDIFHNFRITIEEVTQGKGTTLPFDIVVRTEQFDNFDFISIREYHLSRFKNTLKMFVSTILTSLKQETRNETYFYIKNMHLNGYELYKTGNQMYALENRLEKESCILSNRKMDKYFDGHNFKDIEDLAEIFKNFNVKIIKDNHGISELFEKKVEVKETLETTKNLKQYIKENQGSLF